MSNLTNSPFAELYASKLQDKMDESMAFASLWDNVSSWASNRFVNIPQYTASASIMQDYVEVGGANYSFGDSGDNRVAEGNLRFELISHQTKPITVTSLEDSITNYDKHGGTIRNTISGLVEFKGKSLLFQAGKDVAAAKTILTSGGLTSAGPDGTPRSAMTFNDFVSLGLAFDEDNVSEDGRFIVLPARMYADLISDPQIQKADELGTGEAPIATGVVMKINGINIMKKNTVLQLSGNTDGGDAVDPFTDLSAQGYHGAIAFVRDAVAYATTPVEVFENTGDAKKYGDEFSSQIFGSANAARTDGKGIYIVAQG
tara:strand:- start:3339 stop:4283 length:945 start_codon:yes stop_codon:yes gene_type:complete